MVASTVHRTRQDDMPAMRSSAQARPDDPIEERMHGFVATLDSEANRRVLRRTQIEARWIEDLLQYHGMYSAELEKRLKDSHGSRAYINLTATKTDNMVARLFDLLFPTDDRNWGVQPTPAGARTRRAGRGGAADGRRGQAAR